ncbi:WD40 repeat domain-containing protein [Pseudahrensia aquimaris]|uniref:WD40 repeat domain-containing protein n=1 Tax=Pseudahrensia aquimaris TaxID=744461 RepID=A0ABW3FCN5_9HYPH
MATVAPYDFDCHVEWAGFVEDEPCFALVEGDVVLPTGKDRTVAAHDGLLSAALALDGKSLITGGEDGKVMRVGADGSVAQVVNMGSKWIDVVEAGPQDAVAFASGRTAWLAQADGTLKEFPHERAVEGLAFAPKGMRLACARYNGVSMHWAVGSAATVDLHWDGAHTGVTFSPDGKYIVTSMVENALHGWRLDDKKSGDGKHMRMTGYPAKPKSLSWSPKGKWLASSGAQAAICWPFSGKDGPMGKAPKELGTRGDTMVVQVACHPMEDVLAIGYADGMVMAVRIEDAAENMLRRPGNGAISSLAWDAAGMRLAFGSEEGEAGVISL